MTRLAVVTDIHGNLAALEAVIAHATAQGCTAFVNLGDCLSGPLWPAETADRLIALGWPTIAGNHERQLLGTPGTMGRSDAFARERLEARHIAWIAALPATLEQDDMLLCHGTPASDLEHCLFTVTADGLRAASDAELGDRLGNNQQPLTLCGHTHLPRAVTLDDGRVVANPGSVGLQAFTDDRPYDYIVEAGDPLARYAIVADGELTLHAIGYDHEAAAEKAAGAGFEDWAHALRTGRVGSAQ